jgi:hypothetical protein
VSIERIAEDIADQMRKDMKRTLHAWLGRVGEDEMLLEELLDDGMFWVKHLLVQYACDEQREKIDHE